MHAKTTPMKYLACLALLLTACEDPKADTNLGIVPASPKSARFDVKRVGVFQDGIAYHDQRGIYVITDKETGREYVGVSGVGISETGRHQVGKNNSVEDER